LTRLRFGINRAKKLADIGFGWTEHGGALSPAAAAGAGWEADGTRAAARPVLMGIVHEDSVVIGTIVLLTLTPVT
jgi:hypothetical protein